MPTRLITALLITLISALLAVPASVNAENDDTGPTWQTGTGHWGDPLEPANATWLLLDEEIVAYHITTQNGTKATCAHGNGTLTMSDGTGQVGTCDGHIAPDDPTRIMLTFIAEDGSGTARPLMNGTFQTEPRKTPGPPGTFSTMELLFGLIATLGLTVTTLLAVLLVRERRLTSHLARRLWEKNRGKKGQQEPEHLKEEQVKRILVRSKN